MFVRTHTSVSGRLGVPNGTRSAPKRRRAVLHARRRRGKELAEKEIYIIHLRVKEMQPDLSFWEAGTIHCINFILSFPVSSNIRYLKSG